jgi:hypothetical protein
MNTLADERCKAEILRRLRMLHPDLERRWGRMSAHQMVCHLADCFRMALGQKDVSRATGLLQQTLVKWLALYLPMHWRAGIATRPEINQELTGTRPHDFAADLAAVEALIEVMTGARGKADWPAHPIFGPMSRTAWMRWGYLHTDHHLRQFGV